MTKAKPKPTDKYDTIARPPAPAPDGDGAPASPPVDDGGLADRIRANRAPKPERTTKVYGRAAAKMPQLNVRVPADLKRRLERYCFETGAQMSEVVEALIADHVPEV